MRFVVMQHFGHQRLADASTPVRRLDKHCRAPCGADGVYAAHTPDDGVAIERHILAKRRIVAELIVWKWPPAYDLSQLCSAFSPSSRVR